MQGLPELREAVANFESKKKKAKYTSSNIIIGPGSKELMFLLHMILMVKYYYLLQVGFLTNLKPF